jgi:uncharacterized membrane protein
MQEDASFADIDYARATRRLYWLTGAIGLAGTVVSWTIWGKAAGGGFLLGSIASLGNLWIWRAIARGLSHGESRPSKVAPSLFAARFLALFAIGYVMLRTLNVQPLAMILGLLVSAAAVIAEILLELGPH